MSRTRRSFLRAAAVSPVIATAWVVWETEAGRIKVRQRPTACCVPGGPPNRSCAHPATPQAKPVGGPGMTTRRSRTDLRRRATGLLDQQLWCWGRDIARPEGNVLLGLGMCRYRSTGPGSDRSAYTGRVALWLWGFGLLYCDPVLGGVFLRWCEFDPLLVARPNSRSTGRNTIRFRNREWNAHSIGRTTQSSGKTVGGRSDTSARRR